MVTLYANLRPCKGLRRIRVGREFALSLTYALLGMLALWPTSSMGTHINRLLVAAMADSNAAEQSQDSAEESCESGLPLGANRRLTSRTNRRATPQQHQSPAMHERELLRKSFAIATWGQPPNSVQLAGRLRC